MITFEREEGADYSIRFGLTDVSNVCNKEKTFPPHWITGNHNDIGPEFTARNSLMKHSIFCKKMRKIPFALWLAVRAFAAASVRAVRFQERFVWPRPIPGL